MRSRSGRTRAIAVGATSVLLALGLVACGGEDKTESSDGGAKDPIAIAAVEPITGPGAVFGGPVKGGIDTAVHEINEAGGIDGHMLEVKHYDSQTDPSVAQSVYREALSSKPMVLAGGVTGAEMVSAAPVIASGNTSDVTVSLPTSATDNIPFFFTLGATGDETATGVIAGLKGELGGSFEGKKIALAGVVSPAVDPMLDAIKEQVEDGGGTTGPTVRDPLGFTSWTSQAANVVSSGADAMVSINSESGTAIVANALEVAGFDGPVVSPTNASSDTLLKSVKLPSFLVIRVANNAVDGSDLYNAGVAADVSTDAITASYFAESYASVYAIKAGLEECGVPCSTEDFTEAMKGVGDITVPNDALLGPMNFADGQTGINTAQLFQWDAAADKAAPKGSTFNLH